MPKRLAITIAGAVSLGSYEAGVLFEVLDAISQHNSDPATTTADRVIIDVLTGASAGGMTVIILAQKLLFSAGEFRGAYDNPLYNTWVQRISLAGLQATGQDEQALHSLFSSNLIEAISKDVLLGRYAVVPPELPQRHPAVGDEIRVGVALTNLNGVAYGYEVTPGGQFIYLDYGDQRSRHVVANTSDFAGFWEPLRQAAVACGAFPFAFRVQDVQRSANGEPDDYPPTNRIPWPQDTRTYTYSDGGIFQNQPLGMAKNLVDMIDEHNNQDSRFYLFVSPHAKDPQANDAFHSNNSDYFHLILRLIAVMVGQSGFQDWITAKGVNRRIELLDDRAQGLAQAILNGKIDAACLATTADSILQLFFLGGFHLSPGATQPESLDDAKKRIAGQYGGLIQKLVGIAGAGDAFRDAVLAFETSAGLGARDYMEIYGITANDNQLAGGGLQAFLGFFDQRFRDHDYDVGRFHARAVLQDQVLGEPGQLGPIRYTGSDIRPIDTRLDGLTLSQVSNADLQAFKTGMRKRLNEMLSEMWGPVMSLPAIPGADLILDSVLDRIIAKT